MTREGLYDYARVKGVSDPVLMRLGDRYILGFWVPLGELYGALIVRSKSQGVSVIAEAECGWDDFVKVAVAALNKLPANAKAG